MIITTVILAGFNHATVLGLPPIDGMTGCFIPTASILFGLSYIPAILNENGYDSRLLKRLIQDSVLYFSSIFVVLLTSCLVLFFAPRSLVLIGFGMGSRLLLSMLQQASREH
ncbi:hypothetical protein JB92DRAFT_2953661, partial [Gautieria morchelliformis]